MPDRTTGGLADYLAAERTFLAWVRTGLALMAFGFVVARFGLFLHMMMGREATLPQETFSLSFWFGTVLIVAGVVVNVVSARSYVQQIKLLRNGEFLSNPSHLAIAVALLLTVLGLAMAAYLLTIREPAKLEQTMTTNVHAQNGIVTIESHQSVDQAVQKLERILEAKGINLFALVDHSGEAQKVGMQMRPTKLLIFGNPKAGTPLMIASPTIALDLPLKLLVWEDASGKVQISYNDPAYLQERHDLPSDLVPNIAAAGALAAEAAK